MSKMIVRIGEGLVKVRLSSVKRAKLGAEQDVQILRTDNALKLAQKVELAGGAVAEYLAERYGDDFTPSEFATLAVKLFRDEVLLHDALRSPLADKAKMLEDRKTELTEIEREVLTRVHHSLRTGGELNAFTKGVVDKTLRRLARGL